MEKISALEDAIQKKNLVGIYSVFYTIAHGDPSFSTGKFIETLNYVKSKNIEGFMQEFDGEEFQPENKWNEEYWAFIASSLIDNFCETRIKHLEQVGKKVYALKIKPDSTQGNNDRKDSLPEQNNNIYSGSIHKKLYITEKQKLDIREKNHKRNKGRSNNKNNSIIEIIGEVTTKVKEQFFKSGGR